MEGIVVNVTLWEFFLDRVIVQNTLLGKNCSKCNIVGIFIGQSISTKMLLLEGIVVNVALWDFYWTKKYTCSTKIFLRQGIVVNVAMWDFLFDRVIGQKH